MTKKSDLLALPSDADQKHAKEALRLLERVIPREHPWEVEATEADGKPRMVTLPPVVNAVFLDALAHTAVGRAISLVAIDEK